VGLGFSEGHPEISEVESPFKRVKQNNLFVKGTPSAEFHTSIARPGELVVHKQRVGAFSENQLHLILRARDIGNPVFFGITTSGIVLSTLRRAFDLDYRCVVLKDACFDADEEVHRVLTGKIFPAQATVVRVEELMAGQVE
jgi:nicotinamidase-related amidase